MRLHRLEVEAFGPFPSRQVVDFDELSGAGLFLLHGATGAGKTSVLDAVCFALFGQVPGARREGRPCLRSDHAAEGVVPSVVLELTVSERRFEVTRSPEWQRPKKRGVGTTREPASTDVREWVDGEWAALVGRRSDEAGLLLHDLLGMGLEQFTKVVLLPQGEFAAFLRAGAEQRADLLGRLFDIDRYTGAETWLREERQRLARLVTEADSERDVLVARAQQAALTVVGSGSGHAVDPVHELALATPPGAELVSALAGAALAALETARVACEQARERAEHSQSDAHTAREIVRRLDQRAALLAVIDALAEAAGHHDADVQRLAAARAAQRLAVAFDQMDAAAGLQRTAESDLRRTLAKARAELGGVVDEVLSPGDPEPSGADGAKIEPLLDGLRRRVTRLDEARSLADQATDLDGELLRTDAELAACNADVATAATAVTDADAAIAAAGRQIEQHRDQAASLVAAQQLLAGAQQVHDAALALGSCVHEVASCREARHVAREGEHAAHVHLLDLRERRLQGMAAELASALQSDDPCPVCGSHEHPSLAQPSRDPVAPSTERRARSAHEAAVAAREKADTALAEVTARHAVLAAAAAGLDVELSRSAVEARQHDVDAARLASQEVSQARTRLSQHTAVRTSATVQLCEARDRQGHLEAAASRLTVRRDDLRHRLAAYLGDAPDLTSAASTATAALDAAEQLAAALTTAATARARHAEVRATLERAAQDLGFDDHDTARSALLDDDALSTLDHAVQQHAHARADAAAVLATPEMSSLEGRERPDLDAVTAAAQRALATARTAEQTLAVTQEASSALHRLAAQLHEHDDVHRELRERFRSVDELSRCVDGIGGGNTRRMRLSAFVLAARLEQVASAASERLLAMSDGRYTLAHTDGLAKGGARSGLGLDVVDGWTGTTRGTATLSGGESFLASLALALGLADVVHAEAGGTAIETLFVDEGFGSLDDDTLEEVMGVLDALRDGGRAVGIVSHVADLRTRIPSQLEIVKSRSGSTIRQPGEAVVAATREAG